MFPGPMQPASGSAKQQRTTTLGIRSQNLKSQSWIYLVGACSVLISLGIALH